MIPIHRWARPFGAHFDDLADELPPSHFPTPSQPSQTKISSRGLRQFVRELLKRCGAGRPNGQTRAQGHRTKARI